MGRPEKPIAPCTKELENLVRWLRRHRAGAGLSYNQLAENTRFLPRHGRASPQCSPDTLARAASGLVVPTRRVCVSYAQACGGKASEAVRLWKHARYRESRNQRHEEPAPHITYVRDFAELRAAMLELYRKDGARPYEELERESGGLLAHATVGRVISGRTGRPTRQFVFAFAIVCGARGVTLKEWQRAWDRAEQRRLGSSDTGSRRRPTAPFGSSRWTGEARTIAFAYYMDPARSPNGQEVWHRNPARDIISEPHQDQRLDVARPLTERELAAARTIAQLPRPTTERPVARILPRRHGATGLDRGPFTTGKTYWNSRASG